MVQTYCTLNSQYEIDLEAKRYRRTPRTVPGPVQSERMEYGVWLPLKDVPNAVEVVDSPFPTEPGLKVLHILHETSTHGIYTSALTP